MHGAGEWAGGRAGIGVIKRHQITMERTDGEGRVRRQSDRTPYCRARLAAKHRIVGRQALVPRYGSIGVAQKQSPEQPAVCMEGRLTGQSLNACALHLSATVRRSCGRRARRLLNARRLHQSQRDDMCSAVCKHPSVPAAANVAPSRRNSTPPKVMRIITGAGRRGWPIAERARRWRVFCAGRGLLAQLWQGGAERASRQQSANPKALRSSLSRCRKASHE